jgi:predicted enzyme related to lactoylglutathione lyase
MAHDFCWIELSTDDQEAAKGFYSKLLGWDFEDHDMGGAGTYSMFQPQAGGPGGGIMAKPCAEAPTAWLPYVAVDDLEAAVAKVRELGGAVIVEPTPVPEYGSFAVITDPSGGALGLWRNTCSE